MTSVSLQERLEEATEDLSRCQVASDVAEILRVEGVQGERRECSRCPLSVLVIKRLGLGAEYTVQVDGDSIGIDEVGTSETVARVSLPPAARTWVAEFDGKADYDVYRHKWTWYGAIWDEFAVASP